MDSKISYTLTGLFVVILTTVSIIIVFWLSTGLSKTQYSTYVVYMNESVSGLNVKAPVKYNGVNVGYVNAMELNPHNPKQVRLVLDIEDTVSVREDTRATLMSQGLTGVSFINLSGGGLKSPVLQVKKGSHEKYPIIPAEPSLLFRLDTALKELSGSLTSLSNEMKDLFDAENRLAFKNNLKNIEKLTATLADNSVQIDQTLKSLNITLRNTSHASTQLPDTMNSIKLAGKEMSLTMQTLNQVLPEATRALSQINQLASELQRNPSILVRGKQPASPGPGER